MRKKCGTIVASQGAVAAHFGVSPRTVATWRALGCPGAPRLYDLDAIRAWRAERVQSADDPMMVGSVDSPALERYREARAQLAELDVQERLGRLVDIGELRERISLLAGHLRKAGERIERLHGPEPKRILDEALDELDRAVAEQRATLRPAPDGANNPHERIAE